MLINVRLLIGRPAPETVSAHAQNNGDNKAHCNLVALEVSQANRKIEPFQVRGGKSGQHRE